MTNTRNRKLSEPWCSLRPLAIGACSAMAVTLLLMGAVSAALVLLKSITESTIFPLALAAAGMGCLVGAFICARMMRGRGLLFGALVGVLVFVMIWLISLCMTQPVFGTENAVKIVVLVACGCFGGSLGGKRRRSVR